MCPGSPRQIALLPPEEQGAKSDDARRGDGRHLLLQRTVEDRRPPSAFVGQPLVLGGSYYEKLPMVERVFTPDWPDATSVDHAYQHMLAQPGGQNAQAEYQVDIGAELTTAEYDLDQMRMVERPIGVQMRGTLDLWFVSMADGTVEIDDYKSGVRHVSEIGNTQQLLYLIGLAPQIPEGVQEARLTIVQPESLRTDVPPVRTWRVPLADLPEHRERLTTAARRCMDPDAPLCPGDHCASTFCPARATCPALAARATSVLVGNSPDCEPGQVPLPTDPASESVRLPVGTERVPGDLAFALAKLPDELTAEERADILDAKDMIFSWVNAVESHAYKLAMQGTRTPRHKLGVGQGKYEWTLDPDALRKRLSQTGRIGENGKTAGKLKKEDYITESLPSPNQAKQRIRPLVTPATWKKLAKLIVRKPGSPVLCSETDSREEYVVTSVSEAFEIPPAEEVTPAGDVPDFLK